MSIWRWFTGRKKDLGSGPSPAVKPARPSNPSTASTSPSTTPSTQRTEDNSLIGEAKETGGEAPSSRQFGRLVDHHRRIIGVWVQNAEDAEDLVSLSLYLRELGAPEALCHAALDGNIRVSPNHRDSRGGYFVHIKPV